MKHWADGGETSLDNLVLLCSRHHRMVHEEGFGVHTAVKGDFYFTDQQGRLLPQAGETRFRGNVMALTDTNHQSGIDIPQRGHGHCWDGQRMDDDMAVLCLLQLD